MKNLTALRRFGLFVASTTIAGLAIAGCDIHIVLQGGTDDDEEDCCKECEDDPSPPPPPPSGCEEEFKQCLEGGGAPAKCEAILQQCGGEPQPPVCEEEFKKCLESGAPPA